MVETDEHADEGEDSGEEHAPEEDSEEPVPGPKVLQVPEEAAEPLERVIGDGGRRVVKGVVMDRVEAISEDLDRASERAEEIVEAARDEAETIREEAREEGRREGYEELVSMIAKVRERYRNIQDEAESDMLELAFRIAQRIIGREIEREPETVKQIVGSALEEVRGKRHVVVHTHPDDLGQLESEREELSEELDGASLYFEESSEIERGGCVIETESNRVDATLEMQLERLREAVAGGSE